jgi:hypothetical protein
VLATGLALATPVVAQDKSAVIQGQVVDRRSQAPVQGAVIVLAGTSPRTTTDSAGRFLHGGLAPGLYTLEARAIGYSPGSWVIELAAGDSLRHVFELDVVGYTLPPVVVRGEAGPAHRGLREFERRRGSGRGVFITQQEIEQRRVATLDELLRNVAGLRTVCTRTGCAVQMMRAPRGCQPDFFVDGFPATHATPPNAPAGDIVAVEIYRSLSETPSEFIRPDSRCGVIAIWTRTGASQRR